MPTVERIIICRHGEGGETSFASTDDYEDFISARPPSTTGRRSTKTPPWASATSGTTGKPKGVMYIIGLPTCIR